MFDNFTVSLTFEEIVYSALLAFCVTWFVNNIIKIRLIFKSMTNINKDVVNVMNRCYSLFPIDKLEFHGITFTRGMKIKITTTTNSNIEGEFIGKNTKNMVCIKTQKYIIAHELNNIADIKIL